MSSSSLRNRILLGYGAVLLLLTVALLWSFASLVRLGRASSAILSENYRSILAAETMIAALENQDSAVLLAILDSSGASRQQYREAESDFRRKLAIAEANVTIPGEPEVLSRIATGYDRYDFEAERLFSDPPPGALEVAARRAAYFKTHLPAMQTVRHEATRLRDLNQEAMYAASQRAESLADRVLASAGLLGLTAIGLGLVMSLLLSRHLTKPVEQLRQAAERVAQGDYDVAVDIPSPAELGFLAIQFNDMVERLRLYRDLNIERLLAEKVKTEAILREMSDGLLMVDTEGRFLHVNPAAARALGRQVDDLVGRPARDGPDLGLQEALARALAEPDAPLGTGVMERPGGAEPRSYQYALSRVAAGPGARVGILAILRDVTEMRELDRLKSEFVATASHELRTPITTIGMSLALLEERIGESLDPRVAGLLEAARQDAGRLERLVGDLLDLSKLQAGRIEPDHQPVDVAALLEGVARSFEAQARDLGIDLVVDEIEVGLPAAFADVEQLRRAIANLVSNAIRYTPPNGLVRLCASRVERGVRIEVRDSGPGIPVRQRERIFEKFARADVHGAPRGSGLGLALAREIVIAHGGEIDVEPNSGGGSVFFVVLPGVRLEQGARR